MLRIGKKTIVLAAALAVCGTTVQAQKFGLSMQPSETIQAPTRIIEVMPERAAGTFDPMAARMAVDETYAGLIRDYSSVGDGILVNLSDDQFEALQDNECRTCGDVEVSTRRVRVGVNTTTNNAVDLSGINGRALDSGMATGNGFARRVADGRFVWTTSVSSPDAAALRLQITDFNLPAGVEMFVYNRAGDVFGPYTGTGPLGAGEFWTNTIFGSELLVEVRSKSGSISPDGVRFNINEVGVIGDNFVPALLADADMDSTRAFCSYNASCIVDASCYGTGAHSAMNEMKDAVALMLYVSGPYQYICSGGLLADTVAETQEPYFLTANHCISRNRIAGSLEAYFRYQTTSCNASCDTEAFYWERVLGSSVLATSSTSDFTLLKLSAPAPSFAAFLGWTTTAVANSNGTNLYRVSHPSGAPQAWSTHRVSTSIGTCFSWPRGNWIYSTDTLGSTEGGSSGSPVVNASGQVVGQLSGGCGPNVNDVCDTRNATVDGAFAAYYNSVSGWLNPSTGGGGGDDGGGGGGGGGNGGGNGGGKPKK